MTRLLAIALMFLTLIAAFGLDRWVVVLRQHAAMNFEPMLVI